MSVAATPPVIRKSRPLLRVATAAALVVGSLFAWRPIGDWQQRRFAMQLAERATESESIPQAIAAVNESSVRLSDYLKSATSNGAQRR